MYRRHSMSYQVGLKLRLEDLQVHSVPERCSSSFGRPARERRTLTAQCHPSEEESHGVQDCREHTLSLRH